jgi:hypothetical protein
VECLLVDRRNQNRRIDPAAAVNAALGCVLASDPRANERRKCSRRRGDAASVSALLASEEEPLVKTFALGVSRERQSAIYVCGCVVVDPPDANGTLQLLECPTHAALQAKLRRRRTDRHEGSYTVAKT